MSWYGFIPEGVFTVTSVSTRKTRDFITPLGRFYYHAIQKELFFGYRLVEINGFKAKLADPAKTLLDYLYLNPRLNSAEDFYEMRFNFWELQAELDLILFGRYLRLFDSPSLEKRAKKFVKFLSKNAVAV